MNVLEIEEQNARQEGLASEERAFKLVRKFPGVLKVTRTPRGFFYDADIIFKWDFPVLHDAKLEVKSSQAYVDIFLAEDMVREFQLKDVTETQAWRLANRLIILNAGEHRSPDDVIKSFNTQLNEIVTFYDHLKLKRAHYQVK